MTVLQGAVARPPSGNDEQIALRLPKDWIERTDALRESPVLATTGVGVTRSDVLRAAIARGLAQLEAEHAERGGKSATEAWVERRAGKPRKR